MHHKIIYILFLLLPSFSILAQEDNDPYFGLDSLEFQALLDIKAILPDAEWDETIGLDGNFFSIKETDEKKNQFTKLFYTKKIP